MPTSMTCKTKFDQSQLANLIKKVPLNHVHHRQTFNEPSRKEQNIQNYPLFCANMWPKLLFRLCKPSVLNRICISKYVVFVCFDVEGRANALLFFQNMPTHHYYWIRQRQRERERKRQRDQRDETVRHVCSKTKRMKNNQLNNNRWTNHELTVYGFVNIFSTRLLWLFFHNFFLKSKCFFVLFTQKTCHLLEN